jgi:AraC-like DNA-binding protein
MINIIPKQNFGTGHFIHSNSPIDFHDFFYVEFDSVERTKNDVIVDDEFIKRAIRIITKNALDNSFDVNQLTFDLHVSKSTLHRKFTSIINVKPLNLISSFRIQQGLKILCQTNYCISEIAYKVGFNDPKYFSKCFRKEFGQSPTQYLKSGLDFKSVS